MHGCPVPSYALSLVTPSNYAPSSVPVLGPGRSLERLNEESELTFSQEFQTLQPNRTGFESNYDNSDLFTVSAL